jgi:diaminopropionate ammonia-lyase
MANFDFFLNPASRSVERTAFDSEEATRRVRAFFTESAPIAPTPLWRLPALASRLGLGDVLVKDESGRCGLPAFKIVGVAYAVRTLIAEGTLAAGATLACATTGNHGRAVAHAARMNGLKAVVYVPAGTAAARRDAITAEGAQAIEIDGSYDDAVHQLASDARSRGWSIVSDTSWKDYEEIPRRIMDGYTWILHEARAQWGPRVPDIAIVQGGVGGLVAAASSWFAGNFGAARPFFIACEPSNAACLLASARAGAPTAIPGPLETVMSGLRCAEISPVAWPAIHHFVDAFVSIPDRLAERAMRLLAAPAGGDPSIEAGASGACGMGALLALVEEPLLSAVREASGLDSRSRVLVINTEGATDPGHYQWVIAYTM